MARDTAGCARRERLETGSFAVLHTCRKCITFSSVKTVTLRVDRALDGWLAHEAKRLGKTKSEVIRDALAQHKSRRRRASIHDGMKDVCGTIKKAPRDVSRNTRKYLKGFGE